MKLGNSIMPQTSILISSHRYANMAVCELLSWEQR